MTRWTFFEQVLITETEELSVTGHCFGVGTRSTETKFALRSECHGCSKFARVDALADFLFLARAPNITGNCRFVIQRYSREVSPSLAKSK